ncbi:MAG: biotin/lipoyl-containing protein, partial [Limnobacter sp.]|nr:biotin/lipoyl-containing protein [Limnobacter sp.]
MAVEIKVPDIGDFDEVEVIEVLVKAGERIEAEQSVITVESDKASMEIPAPQSGVVKEMKVNVGDKVSEGVVMLLLEPADDDSAGQGAAQPSESSGKAPDQEAPTKPSAPASGDGSNIEVKVPDIGDFDEVEVIEVLVSEGDSIEAEQSVITVESDKASMEIPAPSAGVVQQLKVKVGDKVSEGTLMLILKSSSGQQASTPGPASSSQAVAPKPETSSDTPAQSTSSAPVPSARASAPEPRQAPVEMHDPAGEYVVKPHASPSVRKFARELGVDLHIVRGSGPKQRITKEDVQAFVKSAVSGAGVGVASTPATQNGGGAGLNLLPWPKLDFSKYGETEELALSRIQKMSGPNLHRNWVM